MIRSLTCIALLSVAIGASAQTADPKYFGQKAPGTTPEVFAPGIVSIKDQFEFGSIYSNDLNEFYLGVKVNGRAETRMLKYDNGRWSEPIPILLHGTYSHNDPALTPDQMKLFFISDRPMDGEGPKKDYDIWYVERRGDSWSEPKNAGPHINTSENQYYISFTKGGKMYFSSNQKSNGKDNYDIHSSEWKHDAFQPSKKASAVVNTPRYEGDVFVAPDESYLIYCANHEGDFGEGDLYVVFKQEDGTWSDAKNLGPTINTETVDFCPFVTPDGKYLMYSSRGDIYWVSMEVVMKLK